MILEVLLIRVWSVSFSRSSGRSSSGSSGGIRSSFVKSLVRLPF